MEDASRRRRTSRWRRFRRHRLAMFGSAIVLLFTVGAIFAPWIAVHDPNKIDLPNAQAPPSFSHIMGHDAAGRDIFSRLLHGSRVTMGIAFAALLIAVCIGSAIGLVSGYVGGVIDGILMRFTEVVMTFPTLFALIILVSVLGGSVPMIALIIGLLGWTGIARLVRGQTLLVREMEFVAAARSLGASDTRILVVHILPSVVPYIAVAGTLGLAGALLAEAAINFLGLGVQIPTPTWGNMMTAAQSIKVLETQPWIWVPPGAAISLTVLAVNFIGDAMRDALDPRIRID